MKKIRSTVSQRNTYVLFEGNVYPINHKKSGTDRIILDAILAQLSAMRSYHNKVLVVRLDLSQPLETQNSQYLSEFLANEFNRIKRQYGIKRIGYAWVREKENAKTQHYHLVMIFDGNKIRNPFKVLNQMKENWKFRTDGRAWIPDNCFYMVRKNDSDLNLGDAIYRLSYLAKGRGKGYRAKTANDYSTSRIKPKT